MKVLKRSINHESWLMGFRESEIHVGDVRSATGRPDEGSKYVMAWPASQKALVGGGQRELGPAYLLPPSGWQAADLTAPHAQVLSMESSLLDQAYRRAYIEDLRYYWGVMGCYKCP